MHTYSGKAPASGHLPSWYCWCKVGVRLSRERKDVTGTSVFFFFNCKTGHHCKIEWCKKKWFFVISVLILGCVNGFLCVFYAFQIVQNVSCQHLWQQLCSDEAPQYLLECLRVSMYHASHEARWGCRPWSDTQIHIMGVLVQASLPFPFSRDNVKLSPFRRCHFKQLTPPWLSKQQDAGKSGWSATAASYSCSSVHHKHISCLKDIFASWCGTEPRTEPLLN